MKSLSFKVKKKKLQDHIRKYINFQCHIKMVIFWRESGSVGLRNCHRAQDDAPEDSEPVLVAAAGASLCSRGGTLAQPWGAPVSSGQIVSRAWRGVQEFFWGPLPLSVAYGAASISVTSFGWWTAVPFRRRAGKSVAARAPVEWFDLSGDNSPLFCFVMPSVPMYIYNVLFRSINNIFYLTIN